MGNDSGQISLDFLLGISIFMLTLGFTIQFVPGLFISSTGDDSDIGYAAYRTASILVEDPGWWDNYTSSGTDWELYVDDVSRIGLAQDDVAKTRLTDTPNLLNTSKIDAFMQLEDDVLVEKMGLYDDVNGAHFDYGYNISLLRTDGTPFVMNNTAVVRGESLPDSRDVFEIKRVVLFDTGERAIFDSENLTAVTPIPSDKTILNVTGPRDDYVTLEISKFNVSGPKPKFVSAKVDGFMLTEFSDYNVYKKTISSGYSVYPLPVEVNATDMMFFEFKPELFPNSTTYQLEINFNQMIFIKPGPPYNEYEDHAMHVYEPAYLTVGVWK